MSSMTTDTLIFKQTNNSNKPLNLVEAIQSIGNFLQRNLAPMQGYCQVRSGFTRGEGMPGLSSSGCDGEIIFHVLAGGVYPIKKIF